jgi:hypothetical protein
MGLINKTQIYYILKLITYLLTKRVGFMTISVDIIKNETQLSLKVNKAVVDYIKRNRVQDGRVATIKTNELLNVAFQFISMVTSNQSLTSTLQYNMLVNVVFSIDVVIMLFIACLYRKEK